MITVAGKEPERTPLTGRNWHGGGRWPLTDIPIGWAIDGANRSDVKLLMPILPDVARVGLLSDIETLYLDWGVRLPEDPPPIGRGRARRTSTSNGADTKGSHQPKPPLRHGLRCIVESTNRWLSNYGQHAVDTTPSAAAPNSAWSPLS